MQLLGVVLGSLQGGLGEATCLAMSAFYDSRSCITFWSSGTGFAGIHSIVFRSHTNVRPFMGTPQLDTCCVLQDAVAVSARRQHLKDESSTSEELVIY